MRQTMSAAAGGSVRTTGWMRVGRLVGLLLTLVCAGQAQAGLDASLERMMGKQAQAAIEAEYPPLAASGLTAYLERIGQQVVKAAGTNRKFTFKVIETEQVNAMALPNGTVYVTTGLLRFVDSPDELAGVIAHEIGHVTRHHSLSSFKKQFWAGLGLGVLGLPSTADVIAQVGTTLALLRYSRKDEEEADRLSVHNASRAGYDPRAMQDFFRKLSAKEKDKPTRLEVYLSTHPPTERRVARVGDLPELDAKSVAAWLAIGDGYLGRGLDYLAAEAYGEAAEIAPDNPAPLLAMARAYREAGRPELALAPARKAAALAPGESTASALLKQVEAEQAAAGKPGPVAAAEATLVSRVKQAGQRWVSEAKALEDRRQALADKREEIARRLKEAARTLGEAGSRAPADGTSEQVLRDAARTLGTLDTLSDHLKVLAQEALDSAQEQEAVATRLAGDLEQPQPAAKLKLLQGWAEEFTAESSQEQAGSNRALALGEGAANTALQAVKLVAEALDEMHLAMGPGLRGTFLAPGSTRDKVEQAAKLAAEARQGLERARQEQAVVSLRRYGWTLNLATVPLKQEELPRWDAVAATFFGVTPPEAAMARARSGGLGWGVLTLAGVPGGRVPEPLPPTSEGKPGSSSGENASAGHKEEGVPVAARRSELAAAASMWVGLFVRQAERELAAGERVGAMTGARKP